MAGPDTIKLFQSIQKFYHTIGFKHSSKSHSSCNCRNLFALFAITQLFITSTAFFLLEANSLQEYSTSFYGSITELDCLVYFATNFFKLRNILKLIENYDKFIEKSKKKQKKASSKNSNFTSLQFAFVGWHNLESRRMYIELNDKIERIFKLLHFLFVEMSIIGVVLPAAVITIINFYVYNLGDESFFLPCPAMYVKLTCFVMFQ